MTSMELVGLNTKWYRYKNNLTQEDYANKTKFKMAYISVIETGNANLTCKNIDFIAKSFNIKLELLFHEDTAKLAKNYQLGLICIEKTNQDSDVFFCYNKI